MAKATPSWGPGQRPDLLTVAPERLTRTERAAIRVVRGTFQRGAVDSVLRFLQRHIGANWISLCMNNLLHVAGVDRLPPLDPEQSYICVANHRSFFDLYVVTAYLMRQGLPHRIFYPVRSPFWYDRPLGLVINGAASFFAMYPPIFRERKKLILNAASLDEIIWLMKQGGMFLGFHPEGTRKKDDDPYTLLPAQRGVGRVIQETGATVLPVFVNGLSNDLGREIAGNFTHRGRPVIVVFGEPIDFGDLCSEPDTKQTHQLIADRCLQVVTALGQEEKQLRAELSGGV